MGSSWNGGRARWSAAACAAGILACAAALRAGDDVAAAPGQRQPEVAEPPPAEAEAQVEDAAPEAAEPVALIHPQVNMAGFTREYRPVPVHATAADEEIRAVLERRVDEGLELREASLREVVERFREALGVPIVIDIRALDDAGVDGDAGAVTGRFSGMTGRTALRIVLDQFGLTFVAADETLTVTTAEKAQERLTQVAYPLPRWAGVNGDVAVDTVVDLIQSTVAMETWDVVGGAGCIRVVETAGEPLLVVSQTGEVQNAVERVLGAIHSRALAEFARGGPVLKVHPVADDRARADLAQRLKDLCNATLGAEADPDAAVESVAETLVVRSRSPMFHALAAQVIAAVAGVQQRHAAPAGGGLGGNPFCWVAREVYGAHDPRWLVFRAWVLTEAPAWFRAAYGRHGAAVAAWLRHRPVAKAAVRGSMDLVTRPAADGG